MKQKKIPLKEMGKYELRGTREKYVKRVGLSFVALAISGFGIFCLAITMRSMSWVKEHPWIFAAICLVLPIFFVCRLFHSMVMTDVINDFTKKFRKGGDS